MISKINYIYSQRAEIEVIAKKQKTLFLDKGQIEQAT